MRVDGLAELERDLSQASRNIANVARGKGSRAVNQIATDARRNAQSQWRGTGATAATIRPRMATDKTRVAGFVFMEGGGAYLEDGTVNVAPRPVLGPALRANEQDWVDAMAEAGMDLLT